MAFWRKRISTPSPVRDYGGTCVAVPAPESWSTVGIAGVIGAGSHKGELVLAISDEELRSISTYLLWLPQDGMRTADGTSFLMDSDVMDKHRTDGTGGLIDLLTRELDVTWTTDVASAERAREWYRTR